MNEQISVQFSVKNQGSENRLGNLQLQFLNSSNDSITAPLGGYENTLQFFAPQQTRDFTVEIDITPSFFIDGGNTVVIWPSMVADPDIPAEPIQLTVYVLGSTGVYNQSNYKSISLVNPVATELQFISSGTKPINGMSLIFSASGQLLEKRATENGRATLSDLPSGIYSVALLRNDEQPLFFRFVRLNP
jgi:hypothetical protein